MAIGLCKLGAPDAVPRSAVALNDEEALGRIGTEVGRQALSQCAEVEGTRCGCGRDCARNFSFASSRVQ